MSVRITAALKREQRLSGTPATLNAAFAKTIRRGGVESVEATRLLDAVQANRVAGRNVMTLVSCNGIFNLL